MTEEHIKEAISTGFMRLLAGRYGYLASKAEHDYGCDLTLSKVAARVSNGKSRFADTGKKIDLQLKCTTEKQINIGTDAITYDLETKNFNDLVYRRDFISPLLLVLMVLPEDPIEWLTITSSEMIVRKAAYWYLPPAGSAISQNKSTTRITIPSKNIVGPTFVGDRLDEVYP